MTEDLAFDGPQTGEIGVKLAACAICHNDINSVEGALVSGAHRVIAMDIVDEKLDELITRTHPLEEINGVVAARQSRRGAKKGHRLLIHVGSKP